MLQQVANKLIKKFHERKPVAISKQFKEHLILELIFQWKHEGKNKYIYCKFFITNSGIVCSLSVDQKHFHPEVYVGSNVDRAYQAVLYFLWQYFGSEKIYLHKSE